MHDYCKLTDYELDALSQLYNLADGHARYSFPSCHTLEERLSHLLVQAQDQERAEGQFFEAFFSLSHQPPADIAQRILYAPSASISIEIVANYLRMQGCSVSLIEPVFDNLADIVKRHGVPLKPLSEQCLAEHGLESWLKTVQTGALFLVVPNNPTGYLFSEADLTTIVDFCVREKKLLILDFSFRFFAPGLLTWNQYDLLERSGVRYIAIEDTGKTWPTYELKVSPLLADIQTFSDISSIYRDIFICHSPLALSFVAGFIQDSYQCGLEASIWSISEANRALLRETIAGTPFKVAGDTNTSVEWLSIENEMDDVQVVHHLQRFGLYVLPGRNFFWSHPQESCQFVRVALMRDPAHFSQGVGRLHRFFQHGTLSEAAR